MARGAGKRAISGWLIVDKPAGMTSTAVVNKVKWAFTAKKAGHAGTLDPDATGLLAVALGEATKTIPYVTDDLKAYEFLVRFGSATNTDDAEGEIVKSSDLRPTDAEVEAAIPAFVGDIMQIPPQFSAIKINGERAYKLARAGEEVEIAPRPLHVESLQMLERVDGDHALLEMVCGKGGYVRSIARDLGKALGCHAHVRHLRRMWSGPFDLDNALTLDQINEMAKTPELDGYLRPIADGLEGVPELTCQAEAVGKFRCGNAAMVVTSGLEYGDLAWVSHNGDPIAIGHYKAGELHPIRVFVPDGQ